jgi:hypothetical protein
VDPELRDALEEVESRLRVHVDAMATGLRDEIRAGTAEARDHVETRAAGLREHIDASSAETKRHMGVLAEGLRSDFRVAAEGIATLNRKFDALSVEHGQTTRRLDLLEARVTVLERPRPRPRRPR